MVVEHVLGHALSHAAHKWLERQAAVPYLVMSGRAAEPRCCCGVVSLTSGAIAVGVLQLVTYCVALLAGGLYILYVDGAHHMGDHRVAAVLASTALLILHIVFNSLLIHGARTDTRHLVLRWVLFQGFAAVAKTAAAAVLVGLLAPVSAAEWQVWGAAAAAALALLTLEWFCFSVGLRLFMWQTKPAACQPSAEPV